MEENKRDAWIIHKKSLQSRMNRFTLLLPQLKRIQLIRGVFLESNRYQKLHNYYNYTNLDHHLYQRAVEFISDMREILNNNTHEITQSTKGTKYLQLTIGTLCKYREREWKKKTFLFCTLFQYIHCSDLIKCIISFLY